MTETESVTKMNNSGPALTNGRLVARNAMWNFVGLGAPLVSAVVVIPRLIDGLGTERYGLLTLVWAGIGYFSFFDIGLGRALTKLVAEKLGHGHFEEIPRLVSTAILSVTGLGVIGSVVVGLLSPWLVHDVLKIQRIFQWEALYSFYLIAWSIPLVVFTTGLCALLEAYQRFDLVNAVRVPLGLFNFVSPLVVLFFSHSLVALTAALMLGRILACFVYFRLCLKVTPCLRAMSPDRSALRVLLSFGSWMTITNIVGPLMVYMDRFFIAALASMTAVTYYTTAYEAVTKLTIIPDALAGALFPAFSASLAQARKQAVTMFERGVNYILFAVFPITATIVAFAGEGLEIWLGHEFARNTVAVLQWLAIGVFINSLARIPFAIIQAKGRPDLCAKLHLLELPLYLVMFWYFVSWYGIKGAAIAWVLRASVDAVGLFGLVYWFLPDARVSIHRIAGILSIALPVLGLYCITTDLLLKSVMLSLTLAVFITLIWHFMLGPEERHVVKSKLGIYQF